MFAATLRGVGVVGYCWPQSVVPGEPVRCTRRADGSAVDVEVVRDSGPAATVWSAQGVAIDEQPLPADSRRGRLRLAVDDDDPDGGPGAAACTSCAPAIRPNAEADPVTAFFVVRAGPTARRAASSCSRRTHGTRTTTSAATTSTPARPRPRSNDRSPPGCSRNRGHTASGSSTVAASTSTTPSARPRHVARDGRVGRPGASVRGVGGAFRHRARLRNERRPRTAPDLLDGCRLYLSVGHDEYWSWAMRDAVERFIEAGGNVAFLSGNTCYWQVRLEGSRMVCYKHRFAEDPVYGTDRAQLTTTIWSDPIVGRPETTLTGVSFTRGGYHRIARSVRRGSGGYEVHRPDHWLLEGRDSPWRSARRGLGDRRLRVRRLRDDAARRAARADRRRMARPTASKWSRPRRPHRSTATPRRCRSRPVGTYELEFHAERLFGDASPANLERLRHGHAVLGTYERGGTVVTAGTTEWAYGLDDPAVDRVTRNIIDTANYVRVRSPPHGAAAADGPSRRRRRHAHVEPSGEAQRAVDRVA